MKLKLKIISTLILLAVHFTYAQTSDFKVIGYFPNWANMNYDIDNLDCSKLTHINWAFQNPDDNGNLVESNNGLSKLVAKAHESDVKVLISIGGGAASYGTTMNRYFNLISTADKRAAFIHKIFNYIKKYDLQGVDVDLEGSAINVNYDAFIQQLCDSLRPQGYLITAALNGSGTDNFKNSTIELFDWINIMSYDATGSWTPNNPGQHASYEYAVEGIESWGARGATRNQLIVGVPFYGHAFNDLLYMDYWNYNQIIKSFPDCYNYDERGNVIYYNGISTIKKKTNLALDRAGGIMIWALSYDVYNEYSLLKAIDDARKSYNPDDKAPEMFFMHGVTDTTIAANRFEFEALAVDSDGVFTETVVMLNDIQVASSNNDTALFRIDNLSDGDYTLTIVGTDHQNRSDSASMQLQVSGAPRSAYNNTPATIPGVIEAENYDAGANNLTFFDNDQENQGTSYRSNAVDIQTCNDTGSGFNVGWTNEGEWLEYTVDVKETATYKVILRTASTSSSRKLHIECDGENITGSISLPNTGEWQTWKNTESERFILEAGAHIIRVAFETGSVNLNKLTFQKTIPLGVEIEGSNHFKVFPNPVKDKATVKLDPHTTSQLDLFDNTGSLIYTAELYNQPEANLDFKPYPSGVYHLVVNCNNQQQILKLVKK